MPRLPVSVVVMVKIKMYKQTIIFIIFTFLLCTISTFGDEAIIVKECVLLDLCDSERTILKKQLLHATGMFEALDDPYSGLEEIKFEFYTLNRKGKEPIYMGIVYMWADHSAFVLNYSKENNDILEVVQIINFGRINDIIIKDFDNDGNDDVTLTNHPKGSEPQYDFYLNKNGKLQLAPAKEIKTYNEIARESVLRVKAEELDHTIITPHLEQEITHGMNVLWCNTFQLAWNELCELTGGTVNMKPSSPMVSILNKKTASKNDLDEDSYVAMAGLANQGIYDKIRKELAVRFKGQASCEFLDYTPQMAWVTYAYLFKDLPFQWAFTRFHQNLEFGGYYVDSFGIYQYLDVQEDEVKMASQVIVLDYKNNDDLIIQLKTQAKEDSLILAKIPPEASLDKTIAAVVSRISKANPMQMREMENLYVPVLDFEVLREYSELYQSPIRTDKQNLDGTSFVFAGQSIRFRLDERGAEIKSKAIIAGLATPRHLVFNKPFLIMLKRDKAKNPYFALWVGNTELLVPKKKKPVEK